MKYFTPELHAQTCSFNVALADAAHVEWESALRCYEKRLEKIRPNFIAGVTHLVDDLRLHDAELLVLGQRGKECFLNLRPQNPPDSIVWLDYALLEDPLIEHNLLPPSLCTRNSLFLYDEVDLHMWHQAGRAGFTHNILFSDGMHVKLKFRDVVVHVLDQLAPIRKSTRKRAVQQPA